MTTHTAFLLRLQRISTDRTLEEHVARKRLGVVGEHSKHRGRDAEGKFGPTIAVPTRPERHCIPGDPVKVWYDKLRILYE